MHQQNKEQSYQYTSVSAVERKYLRASAPYFSITSIGSTPFPSDLLILRPCSSRTRPWISTSLNGNSPKGGSSLYEVGEIGGVYRNKETENGKRLIGGSTADAVPVLSQVGVLSYQIPTEGSSYVFSDEKGRETVAVKNK